ncbi:MAG: MsnO8 family LLM class oxidoreductase [Pseudonocardiaceae bacterium]|nr:MsnO8 family LLM class oxidoreductase [Pseudonocardiaceae bacterium]
MTGPTATGATPVPLSVLDLAPVGTGSTPGHALRASLELASRAEDLGFTRYWLAEHHNMPGIASSATAVMIGQVAAVTSRMRIGSGGVMLPNHAPLVVAEQFGTLEALYPGRIDLGIGRAPGTDQATAMALRRSAEALSADDFPDQLVELRAFLSGRFPDGHPYAGITAVPGRGATPAVWLLGSSGFSAQVAGHLGLPFAFAHHFSATNTLPALELYRATFRPSDVLARPYAMVTASVVCAEDDQRARWLAAPGGLSFLRLRAGRPTPLPSPEEAAAAPLTGRDRAVIAQWTEGHVVGTPDAVREQLADLQDRTGADELMISTMLHDPADRLHSYELVAGAVPFAPSGHEAAVGG